MDEPIKQILAAIAQDVLVLAQLILEDKATSEGEGAIVSPDGVRTYIASYDNPTVIEALFDNYVNYIENGRKPRSGIPPPISALLEWATSRGISTENGILYAIANAIWRDGREGRPVLSKLYDEVGKIFDKEYYNKLFDAVIQQLTKFFN